MDTYYVSLVETIKVHYRILCGMRVVFQCLAEDFAHAEKQAKSAYPDCIIISIDKEK